MGIAEARRLLPDLVEAIGTGGGRVDITRHGEARVSLVRTRDLDDKEGTVADSPLRVELAFPAEELVEVVREVRARLGTQRRLEVAERPRRARRTAGTKSRSKG